MTKPGLRVLLWGGTAAVVTVLASLAVAASVTAGGSVLTPADVANALTPTGTATRPGPTATHPTPGATDATGEVPAGVGTAPPGTTGAPGGVSAGPDQIGSGGYGTVTVRCQGNLAELRSWSPNPGFRADDPVRGPAAQVGVTFESDVSDDVIVTATCSAGEVSIVARAEPDDHGGGSGRGGGPGRG